jgi:cysteinyl-tRNA synthetase
MSDTVPLHLFNSLTRSIEPFTPVHPGEARVYSCGPTVYNYQHIGNMRAYVFADTLGRTLAFKGYALRHVINITDVGHLTSDADEGDDKMEKAAASLGKTAWDIAAFYTAEFKRDLGWLHVRDPYRWTVATTDEGEGRIEEVEGKRHGADFAIWRKTPEGETRQMEWDSPWGRGAPGWHLECSVMSRAELGLPFDIHTGGIDHREIHHPNEIAQNQAIQGFDAGHGHLDCAQNSGARIWMHNNFLIDRGGKMSKSAGEFLRLQLLVDRGYHPLAYRLLCLQAHYRSELEFSWDNLGAALTRLKRMVGNIHKLKAGKLTDSNTADMSSILEDFDKAISEDLNTPKALSYLESAIAKTIFPTSRLDMASRMDAVLGLGLLTLTRADLRLRPATATITEDEIEAQLAKRKEARAAKDFATSDAIRDVLIAAGVEVMDGDPLGWEWRLD